MVLIMSKQIPKKRPCKDCNIEHEYISQSGLCSECGNKRLRENIMNLKQRKGESYHKWRKALIASMDNLSQD